MVRYPSPLSRSVWSIAKQFHIDLCNELGVNATPPTAIPYGADHRSMLGSTVEVGGKHLLLAHQRTIHLYLDQWDRDSVTGAVMVMARRLRAIILSSPNRCVSLARSAATASSTR